MADINDRLERLNRREEFARREHHGLPPSTSGLDLDDDFAEVLVAVARVVQRHAGLSVMVAAADGRPGRTVIRVTEQDGRVVTAVVAPPSAARPVVPPPVRAVPPAAPMAAPPVAAPPLRVVPEPAATVPAWPVDRPSGYGGRHSERYGDDRYRADRYGADQVGADRYGPDRYEPDRYEPDRYEAGGRAAGQHGAQPFPAGRVPDPAAGRDAAAASFAGGPYRRPAAAGRYAAQPAPTERPGDEPFRTEPFRTAATEGEFQPEPLAAEPFVAGPSRAPVAEGQFVAEPLAAEPFRAEPFGPPAPGGPADAEPGGPRPGYQDPAAAAPPTRGLVTLTDETSRVVARLAQMLREDPGLASGWVRER